jgi:hypothetical protein
MPGWEREVDPGTGLPRFLTAGSEGSAPCPVIPLPADALVAHATNAQSRGDLVAIQEHVGHLACMVMGVHPTSVGLFGASDHSGERQEAGTQSQLEGTVERFRQAMSRVLLDVYELVYEGRAGIAVIFPGTQNEARMGELFAAQILTYDAYKQFLVSKMCADKDMFEKRDPRLVEAKAAAACPKKRKKKAEGA